MRRSSAATIALALLVLLALEAGLGAHRRDDYLQAARIGIEPDHVAIDLDLTPGAAVADALIAGIDADRDGALSSGEQERYVRRVRDAVSITIDGRPLALQLVATSFPDLAAARRGDGAIRLRLRADTGSAATGSHQLYFSNAHLPDHSAYLVNALVPESARVSVTAQRRATNQSQVTIEYAVDAAPPVASHAPLAITLTFAAILLIPLRRLLPRTAMCGG